MGVDGINAYTGTQDQRGGAGMVDPRGRSAFSGAEHFLQPGMVDQVKLGWRLLRDPRVPWIKNALPAFAALYLISPIDPIPDFLLGLGQLDDFGILVAMA